MHTPAPLSPTSLIVEYHGHDHGLHLPMGTQCTAEQPAFLDAQGLQADLKFRICGPQKYAPLPLPQASTQTPSGPNDRRRQLNPPEDKAALSVLLLLLLPATLHREASMDGRTNSGAGLSGASAAPAAAAAAPHPETPWHSKRPVWRTPHTSLATHSHCLALEPLRWSMLSVMACGIALDRLGGRTDPGLTATVFSCIDCDAVPMLMMVRRRRWCRCSALRALADSACTRLRYCWCANVLWATSAESFTSSRSNACSETLDVVCWKVRPGSRSAGRIWLLEPQNPWMRS